MHVWRRIGRRSSLDKVNSIAIYSFIAYHSIYSLVCALRHSSERKLFPNNFSLGSVFCDCDDCTPHRAFVSSQFQSQNKFWVFLSVLNYLCTTMMYSNPIIVRYHCKSHCVNKSTSDVSFCFEFNSPLSSSCPLSSTLTMVCQYSDNKWTSSKQGRSCGGWRRVSIQTIQWTIYYNYVDIK